MDGVANAFMTDDTFTKARITEIDATELKVSLDNNFVAVIPGFQGVTDNKRITTLGRGGSDTTAVALAAALSAKRCDIYTDVDGVYTTDPRIVSKAQKIDAVTYEEMLEMASQGARFFKRGRLRWQCCMMSAYGFCPLLKTNQEPWF